jgi:GDP-L-fucose synthase
MKKILVFGSGGLVGNSLKRTINEDDFVVKYSTREDTNLFSLEETQKTINEFQPNIIINAAAKVGGIHANNSQRSEFLIENLKININILESCIKNNDILIVNLGSSCIYPLNADNPIKEESIMSGKLEPTNSPYAMAKLTGIELANSLSLQFGHKILNLMPTNLYGPNDNFSEMDSHVIPGLIFRMHNAKINGDKEFKIWGTGKPLREFMYVDDLAKAILFLINNVPKDSLINVGSGEEISIENLSILIKEIVGYKGILNFDSKMPDGNPRKLLDSTLINELGWTPEIDLNSGIKKTYKWFLENYN